MKKIFILSLFLSILLFLPTSAENVNQEDFEVVEPVVEDTTINENEAQEQIDDNESKNVDANEDEEEEDIDYNDFLDSDIDDTENSNAIILDTTPNLKPNIKKQSKIKEQKIQLDKNKDSNISSQILNTYGNDPYEKKTTSFTKEKKVGDFSFGTSYNSSITPNDLSQTRTLFSKYQKDNLSLKTSYQNNTFSSFGQQFNGTFSLSPEYKLNNHLSLQGVYSRNILDKSNKNELIFSLKPFNDDRMNFNVGASQINYDSGAPTRSQLNFSTKINF